MRSIFILVFFFLHLQAIAQATTFPFEIQLKADSIIGFNGLHSFAFGQLNDRVVLIGGRQDGIHARQPFNAFASSQNNTSLQLLDLTTNQFWSAPINSLSSDLQEQLQSTNMNFFQDGNELIIAGGYAFSNAANDHITFPNLTRIDLNGLMHAIIDDQPISPYFEQITDQRFAVTGGNLTKIGGQYYLVGGHRFDGRYNPMNNPTFVQSYVDGLKIFELSSVGQSLEVLNYQLITDQVNLHRRDYNLLPHIYPNGEIGALISSGVFQINADLPFLYPVEVKSSGHEPVVGFSQYLSNYHSSKFSAYDSMSGSMHHIFLGGLSEYYYQNGTLINDENVPFVSTISRLSQGPDGSYQEYVMQGQMPGLLGSSAEFIHNQQIAHYAHDIIDIATFNSDSILIGHIIGGLKSTQLNPFINNNTNSTSANAVIYEVWLKPSNTGQIRVEAPLNATKVQLFPNPARDILNLDFDLDQKMNVECFVLDPNGKIVHEVYYQKVKKTSKHIDTKALGIKPGLYSIHLIFNDQYLQTKQILIK